MKLLALLFDNNKTLLGRWEHNISQLQKNIKFDLANIDHCGDKICGIPKTNPYTNSFTSKYLTNYKLKTNKINYKNKNDCI